MFRVYRKSNLTFAASLFVILLCLAHRADADPPPSAPAATMTVPAQAVGEFSSGATSASASYSASVTVANPAVTTEQSLTAGPSYSWSGDTSCSPATGSSSTTVTYTSTTAGQFNSNVSCTITWTVHDNSNNEDYTITSTGSGSVTIDLFQLTVKGGSWSPNPAYCGDSVTGNAQADITPDIGTASVNWATVAVYSSSTGQPGTFSNNGFSGVISWTQGSTQTQFTRVFLDPGYYIIEVSASVTVTDSSGNNLCSLSGDGYIGGKASDVQSNSGGSSQSRTASRSDSAAGGGAGIPVKIPPIEIEKIDTSNPSSSGMYYKVKGSGTVPSVTFVFGTSSGIRTVSREDVSGEFSFGFNLDTLMINDYKGDGSDTKKLKLFWKDPTKSETQSLTTTITYQPKTSNGSSDFSYSVFLGDDESGTIESVPVHHRCEDDYQNISYSCTSTNLSKVGITSYQVAHLTSPNLIDVDPLVSAIETHQFVTSGDPIDSPTQMQTYIGNVMPDPDNSVVDKQLSKELYFDKVDRQNMIHGQFDPTQIFVIDNTGDISQPYITTLPSIANTSTF